jgi:very-short-patch-repair endonuclease
VKSLWILVAFVVVAVLIIGILKAKLAGGPQEEARKRDPLSANEQAMFNRLKGALPQYTVLAQVSFGALLTARLTATRNTFDRKIADFVVCDPAFQVLAVIELDDASHKKKGERDARRDAMLTAAGYRVLRYSRIPDIDRVQMDFASVPLAGRGAAGVA